MISCILQMFRIEKALDEHGREKPVNPHWVTGLTV